MKESILCLSVCTLAFLISCSNGTDTDTTPPRVISTNPADQYDSASVHDPITATFSEEIDPGSVDTSTFELKLEGPNLSLVPRVSGRLSTLGRVVTFTSDTTLDYSTEYVSTLKTGIRDMAGNSMTSDYSWTFTTEHYIPGSAWTQRESGTDNFLYGVDRSGNRFVAVGYLGTILTSSDGIDWSPVSFEIDRTLLDILWTGDQFMAVGKNIMANSPDGLSWTRIGRIAVTDEFWLEGVASSGDKLVAVDSRAGRILSSIDGGESWIVEHGPVSGRMFWEITWSGSAFVAVGAMHVSFGAADDFSAMVAISEDGSDWSYIDLGIQGELFDVAWTGSQLVAVGGETLLVSGAMIVTSPDGLTWTERRTDVIDPLFAVWTAGSTIIAVGYEGTILTSEDGINWTERVFETSAALYGVTSSEERVVVVGTHGTILTSP